MEGYSIIGKKIPGIDWVAKATGKAEYAIDMALPKMLYGKVLTSPYPHAGILSIDFTKAERIPGVRAIITHKDTLGRKTPVYSLQKADPELISDEYPLAKDKVRYIGDSIVALAAVDEDTGEEALDLIEVEYEELPAVFDPEKAMKPDAPCIHDSIEGNICSRAFDSYGDVGKGFRESSHIREDEFKTNLLAYSTPEPRNCMASYDPVSGKLIVWGSFQMIYWIRKAFAYTLGIPWYKVRVIHPHVGGYFGTKSELYSSYFCAALLSIKTGRPVKVSSSRGEDFFITSAKHPMIIKMNTGIGKDGKLMAHESKTIVDVGAYKSVGAWAAWAPGYPYPYLIPNRRYEGLSVYTNKTPCGANRGYGHHQIVWTSELHMELLCNDVGMDPMEFRLKNALEVEKPHTGQLRDCLERAVEEIGWKQRKVQRFHGIGVACALGGDVGQPSSIPVTALVRVGEDGMVTLSLNANDGGTGQCQGLLCIVAEEMGISLEHVRLSVGDTDLSLDDLGDHPFTGVPIVGRATLMAARKAKEAIFEVVASRMEADVSDLETKEGRIFIKGMPEKGMFFSDAAKTALDKKEVIEGKGEYRLRRGSEMDKAVAAGRFPPAEFLFETWHFGSAIAEVITDKDTGKIDVVKVASAYDVGTIIHPLGVEGQFANGVSLGMGQILYEDVILEKEQILNPSLLEYKVHTAMEAPEIIPILVENKDPSGPFGAKEAGVGVILSPAPAIAKAIYNATGVMIKEFPIAPEKILIALEKDVRVGNR